MICTAISSKSIDQCLSLLKGEELAEIRIDLCGFNVGQVINIFQQAGSTKLIATCRPDNLGYEEASKRLRSAIENGANYVDIEYEAPGNYKNELISIARQHQCDVIISYHNYEFTPTRLELEGVVDECFYLGADVAKLATMVKSEADNVNLLSLYNTKRRIVAIGMGEKGRISRVLALRFGAEFSFAAPDNQEGTAPGQLRRSEMKSLLDGLRAI
jgi:3-dehydroquinate dehydratase I